MEFQFLLSFILVLVGIGQAVGQSCPISEFHKCQDEAANKSGHKSSKESLEVSCNYRDIFDLCYKGLGSRCEKEPNFIALLDDLYKSLECKTEGLDCPTQFHRCVASSEAVSGVNKDNFKDKTKTCRYVKRFNECRSKELAGKCDNDGLFASFMKFLEHSTKTYKCGCASSVASLTLLVVALFFVYQKKF